MQRTFRKYAVKADDGTVAGYVARDVVNPRYWIGFYVDGTTRMHSVDASTRSAAAAQVRVLHRSGAILGVVSA